jgi:hypothetical protein
MSTDTRAIRNLLDELTADQARDALVVLLSVGDPAARWALEAIAIAAPGDLADRARALKGNPVRPALEGREPA